jgi:aspartokinase/homoserine dehydrogenase 1
MAAPERRGTEIGAREPLQLVIAGATGNVGSALVRQFRALQPDGVKLRILPNSKHTNDARACGSVATDWPSTLRSVEAGSLFVDCTASADVAALYEDLLESGSRIVTANKRTGAGSATRWRALQAKARRRRLPLRYETTVGAGLPLLKTARDLALTGDRLLSLEAVLSATISFILAALQNGCDFSAAVSERTRGVSPSPIRWPTCRGADVAAKLLILRRELGIAVEADEVDVDPLARTADEIRSADATWRERAALATARAEILDR